ncbi:MAG: hypothetical protein AAFY14_08215, partial [Pseudomonadota bacterium]
MTPALTLTLSAEAMHAVSAVIGQQMKLADVMIDQTYAAQRALMTPYWNGAPATMVTAPATAKPKAVTGKKAVAPKPAAKAKAAPKPAA